MLVDDLPKLVLVLLLSAIVLLSLWASFDRRSAIPLRLRDGWRGRGRRLVLGLVAAGVLWVVTEDVLLGESTELVVEADRRVQTLVEATPPRLHRAASIVSRATGEGLGVATAAVVVALSLRRRHRDAWTLAFCVLAAWMVSGLLKILVAVPRPRASAILDPFTSYGFPSGHAFVTLVAGSMAVWVLADRAPRWLRATLYAAVWLVAILSGASRVVLNAHWPSDVIAALALGGLWMLGSVTVVESRVLHRLRVARGRPQASAASCSSRATSARS